MRGLMLPVVVGLSMALGCIDGTPPSWVEQDERDPGPGLGLDEPSGVGVTEPLVGEPEPDPDPVGEPEPEPIAGEPESEPVGEPAPDPIVGEPDPVDEPEPDPAIEEPAGPKVVLLLPGTTIAGEEFTTMYYRLLDDGFTPLVYEEPNLFTGSLAAGAEWVGEVVEELKDEFGVAQIDIVGQCDGGVVARYYASVLGGAANVRHLVTFVAPHHGSQLSGVGSWLCVF